MKLFDRNNNILELKDKNKILKRISELEAVHKSNPTKDLKPLFNSLVPSEVFSSLLTEGEISSRRLIKHNFNKGVSNKDSNFVASIDDFFNAFNLVLNKKKFGISSFFNLYSSVSRNGIEDTNVLDDGHMFRTDKVFISSNSMSGDYEGFPKERIKQSLEHLSIFLNNIKENIFLRSIIGHIYFEIIHPYYDFNGRTGRFIPLWVFVNENRISEMLYFSTAVGNYREQYLSIFKKYIDQRTYKVDLDAMVLRLLDLLILNQKQYIWIKNIENSFIDKTNKSFSAIQKDFIWKLMIKSEISKQESSWFKLTKDDKEYIELNLKDSLFSKNLMPLKDSGIINISSDKPRKYKLNNYKLFGLKK